MPTTKKKFDHHAGNHDRPSIQLQAMRYVLQTEDPAKDTYTQKLYRKLLADQPIPFNQMYLKAEAEHRDAGRRRKGQAAKAKARARTELDPQEVKVRALIDKLLESAKGAA